MIENNVTVGEWALSPHRATHTHTHSIVKCHISHIFRIIPVFADITTKNLPLKSVLHNFYTFSLAFKTLSKTLNILS